MSVDLAAAPAARTGTEVPAWCFVGLVAVGAVLRFWGLGAATLSADESYSAVAAHQPVGRIWGFIASTDPHPPLSYLLLSPFAHLWTSTTVLRLPAAVCAVLALMVFAWWQRDRGIAGVVATAVFALSPFLLEFARQARMYGLLTLGAVVLAVAADRWLRTGSVRWAAVAGGAAFVMAMTYSAGPLMLGALFLVPGWRRDRAAWQLRIAAGAAAGAWAALWLVHALHWSGSSSGYPDLTVSWGVAILNDLVAPVPSNQWLVLGLLGLGLALALWRPGPSRRLLVALFVAPVLVLLVVSLHNNIFLPKSLVMVAWVPPVLFGTVVEEIWRIRPLVAGVAVALMVVVTVPYIHTTLTLNEGTQPMLEAVARARAPGDAIAMDPANLGTLLDWYDGIAVDRRLTADDHVIDGAVVYRVASEDPTGRVWLVRSRARAIGRPLPPGASSCGGPRDVAGGYTLQCVDLTRTNQ